MLTLADLGVLRRVEERGKSVTVAITPTYSGCPALAAMRDDLVRRLTAAGYAEVRVEVELSPAWSSDWISAHGRQTLAAAGISPPGAAPAARSGAGRGPVPLTLTAGPRPLRCPRCGSARGAAAVRIRRYRVPGGVPVRGVPGTVQSREGDLIGLSRAGGCRGGPADRRRGGGDVRGPPDPGRGVRVRGRAVADAAPGDRRHRVPADLLDLRAGRVTAPDRGARDSRRAVLILAGARGAAGGADRGAGAVGQPAGRPDGARDGT